MGAFFIDTKTGQIATRRQLADADMIDETGQPPRPWHPVQGTTDASTMWHTVVRKRERDVFIGALVLRHSDRLAFLLQSGWQEVELEELRDSRVGLRGQAM